MAKLLKNFMTAQEDLNEKVKLYECSAKINEFSFYKYLLSPNINEKCLFRCDEYFLMQLHILQKIANEVIT